MGLDLERGEKYLDLGNTFKDGTRLYDAYSEQYSTVEEGKVRIDSEANIVLLGKF